MTERELFVIALGIALGMFFFRRTGYSPGGIITPGFLALELASPERMLSAFLCAGAVALLLSLAVRGTGVYGRQRTGLAMLLALGIRFAGGGTSLQGTLWIGWVVPGLLGAEMYRQGVVPTVGASLSTAFAAAMASQLLSPGGILF